MQQYNVDDDDIPFEAQPEALESRKELSEMPRQLQSQKRPLTDKDCDMIERLKENKVVIKVINSVP